MQHHYTTSARRAPRWKPFILDVTIPLLLIALLVSAWIEQRSYWVIGLAGVFNIYVTARTTIRTKGKYEGEVFFGLLAAECFALSGYYINIVPSDLEKQVIGMSLLLLSFISMLFAVTTRQSALLRSLTAQPRELITATTGKRTEDFPGVYRITCKPNGMVYIGMTSRPIKERWNEHLHNFKAGRHHNDRMQHDWNLYRSEHFTWEVLEVVTDQAWLFDRERYWQDLDYATDKRYNPPNTPRIIHSHGKRPKPKR